MHFGMVDKYHLDLLHGAGKQLHAWTINHVDLMRRMLVGVETRIFLPAPCCRPLCVLLHNSHVSSIGSAYSHNGACRPNSNGSRGMDSSVPALQSSVCRTGSCVLPKLSSAYSPCSHSEALLQRARGWDELTAWCLPSRLLELCVQDRLVCPPHAQVSKFTQQGFFPKGQRLLTPPSSSS